MTEDSAGNRFEEFDMIGGERIRVTSIGHADWARGPTIRIQKRMASGQLAPGPEFPARFAGDLAKALFDVLATSPGAVPAVFAAVPTTAVIASEPTGPYDPDLYARLVDAARKKSVVAYGDLETLLGLDMENPNDRKRMDEVKAGRPMLSSVVWHKDMSSPGRGFYNLGIELGRVRGGEDELAFAMRELNATYETWSGK
jgi:hypothetical protein